MGGTATGMRMIRNLTDEENIIKRRIKYVKGLLHQIELPNCSTANWSSYPSSPHSYKPRTKFMECARLIKGQFPEVMWIKFLQR